MSEIAILILAAGSSSRMGKAKQLLPFKHTTLLGWAIEQAQATNAENIICVLGANVEKIEKSILKYNVRTVLNTDYLNGLSASIVKGIKELKKEDAVLIILADQPNITSEYLNKLLEKYRKTPSKIIASNYNGFPGVPAIFPKKYYPELLNLRGDMGAKEFLNNLVQEIVIEEAIDLHDIDFPEDYRRLNG